jgi:hypothetical protein
MEDRPLTRKAGRQARETATEQADGQESKSEKRKVHVLAIVGQSGQTNKQIVNQLTPYSKRYQVSM